MNITGHILLVDDEKDFLDTLSFWLESKGYTVKTTQSGKQALEMVDAEKPYLIFMDINMPEMSGIELLGELRKKNKTIPVIMLTAASSRERMQAAEELGISGFFPKQESLEMLVKLIDVTLRTHEKRQ